MIGHLEDRADVLSPMATITASLARSNKLSPTNLLITNLGSRGSLMLRAALSVHVRQENKQPLAASSTMEDNEASKQAQDFPKSSKSGNSRRSPGSKVLFSEPVVTEHFEYEPTCLSDEEEARYNDERAAIARLAVARKNNRLKRNIQNHPYRETSDDASLYLAKHAKVAKSDNFTTSAKGPRKRTRCHSSDSEEEIKALDNATRPGYEESLFSSPKVAKIAPYYHELAPEANGSEGDGHVNSALQQSQRIDSPSPPDPLGQHSVETITLESQEHETKHIPKQDPTPEHQEMELSQAVSRGYLSWLTYGLNYLSSRVNAVSANCINAFSRDSITSR